MDTFTLKPFRSGGSQAIRLPGHLRFDTDTVHAWRDPASHNVILSRQPDNWHDFFNQLRFMPPPDFPHGQHLQPLWHDSYPQGSERWNTNLPFDPFDEFDEPAAAEGDSDSDGHGDTDTDTGAPGTPGTPGALHFHLAPDAVRDLFYGHRPFINHLQQVPMHAIGISAIVAGLVEFGWRKYPDETFLRNVCAEFLCCAAVIAWDRPAATTYGELRAGLLHARASGEMRCRGAGPDGLEVLIAAHALSERATLVTRNPRYRTIPGLHTVDWTLT